MNKVELESFLKSFLLFFISLSLLIGTLFYINFSKEIQTLDEQLLSQMRVCSFDLKCTNFQINFLEHKNEKLYTLYKDKTGLTSYYPIPNSTKHIMSFYLSEMKYAQEVDALKENALWNFFIILIVIIILSILFSLYALYPLKNALNLTQEFIKDILHDFNTPLSSLRLNSSMLKREFGENEKINRIEASVENILSLQNHLHSYLHNHKLQSSEFNLQSLIQEQILALQKIFPNIIFHTKHLHVDIRTNKEAFNRIIVNILTNASKYNIDNGRVDISYNQDTNILSIADTGKGIKNPNKIFDRFYKEQDRGIGIGLHIVDKLSQELGIKIRVTSIIGTGTNFELNLSKLTYK